MDSPTQQRKCTQTKEANFQFSLSELTRHHRGTRMELQYNVPTKFHDRLCMCEEPGPVLFGTRRPGPYINCCATCRKPHRYLLRRCTHCGEWYIKDFFKLTYECSRHSKCWNCVESTQPCGCLVADSIPYRGRPDFGPLGLNPREFSTEELAGFDPLL